MKRPWILTPKGQRSSLHIANLLSLALFLGFAFHFTLVESPRQQVVQLDTANVTYCELDLCPAIQGLELVNPAAAISDLEQRAFGTAMTLDFSNRGRLEGSRVLWVKVISPSGVVIEMASTEITMNLKNRTRAEFLFVSTKTELSEAKILLGY